MRVQEILEKLDLKPSGVLDAQGNQTFNVIDTDTGKTVKTFSGPNAAGQAEQFRDTQNRLTRQKGIKVGGNTLTAPDVDNNKLDD